jgi:hypothetical protein
VASEITQSETHPTMEDLMSKFDQYAFSASQLRWPRLIGQIFRFDKWIVCRG